jgi:MoxR-like ATPase
VTARSAPAISVAAPVDLDAARVARGIVENVCRALEGKQHEVELATVALLAGGHLLIEDVPGVGKTTLARALACSLGLTFRRVQFTSDLMPADVLGGSVYDRQTSSFSFRPGPIFTHVLLADEINRTTPKTQSALLEAMGERRVSIDGDTHVLEEPFFVVATQNPEEFYGTYPLPESQLDRFMLRLRLGYPSREVERAVLAKRRGADPLEGLDVVATRGEVLAAQASVDDVRTEEPLLDYVHEVIVATRESPLLSLGASTRAALALERATRAHALLAGRAYATPDDVKAVAVAVLAHRVRVTGSQDATADRTDAERVIRDLLSSIAVPV